MHLHDVETLLAHRGWQLDHITGSHRHYRNAHGQRLTIAVHGRHTFSPSELNVLRSKLVRLATEHRERSVNRIPVPAEEAAQLPILSPPAPRLRTAPAPARRRHRVVPSSLPTSVTYTSPSQVVCALPFPVVVANWLVLERTPHDQQRAYALPAHTCQTCGAPGATWRLHGLLTQEEWESCPGDGPEMGEWVHQRAEQYPMLLDGHAPPTRWRRWLCPSCAREVIHLHHDGTSGIADRSESDAEYLVRFGIHPMQSVGRVIRRRNNETEQDVFNGARVPSHGASFADVWYPNGSIWIGLNTNRSEELPRALAETYEAESLTGLVRRNFCHLAPRYRDPATGDIPAPRTCVMDLDMRRSMVQWNDRAARAMWLSRCMQDMPGITPQQVEELFDRLADHLAQEENEEAH